MGGINFSPILFILSKKLYLCIKQELFGRIATQFTEFMTVTKSLPRSLRNTYKLIHSYLYIEFLKKQSIYKEWLFSTLVAIAFYLLTYCFNLEEGFSVIFWSLIGSLITLISIWIYRYILNKNNYSHT